MFIEKVKPIIIYPNCLSNGIKQDCFNCGNRNNCISPRSMCLRPYHNHPDGCPNYGIKKGCPPNIEMFDQIYDISKDIFAIITVFDLAEHIKNKKIEHPDWTDFQLRNSRYWQGTDKKNHKPEIKKFNELYSKLNYVVTTWPEGMGVNLIETLKQVNIILKFPVIDTNYRVSLAGILLDDVLEKYNFAINSKFVLSNKKGD